jgi:vitamin B12 transporter
MHPLFAGRAKERIMSRLKVLLVLGAVSAMLAGEASGATGLQGSAMHEEAQAAGQAESGPAQKGVDDQGAEEVFVVSATRLEEPVEEVGSSVTVISGEQLRERGAVTVLEALRGVPSLDIVQNGGPGQTATVMIRGAKSEHTLVMIDGIEVNDPSTVGRLAIVGSLSADAVERIEIVRGPQSTLYGSDAMGGVINIITRKGAGKPSGSLEFKAGSFGAFTGGGQVMGSTARSNYMLGVSFTDSDGISAASSRYGNGEDDGWKNLTLSTRLGWTPGDSFEGELTARFIDDSSDLDNYGGPGGDDPNYTMDSTQLFIRPRLRLKLLDGLWDQSLGLSFTGIERDYRNRTDARHPDDSSKESYKGRMIKVDWQHNLRVHEGNTVVLGLEEEKESMKSDYDSESAWGPYSSTFRERDSRTSSVYVQDSINVLNSWFTTLGMRIDDHDRFGSKTTWRASSSYALGRFGTRIRASIGTAFKAPSLYQLFSPEYGNRALDPETSTGWDAGVEQKIWGDSLALEVTYFSNRFEDLIDFDSATSRYVNVNEAKTSGIESSVTFRPTGRIDLTAAYTFTGTEDSSTDRDLLRRPRNKASLDADVRIIEDAGIHAQLLYVGARDDAYYDQAAFTSVRVRLDPYTVTNLWAWYSLNDNARIFVQVDNLFDRDYEEIYGYGTPGLSCRAGLRMSF